MPFGISRTAQFDDKEILKYPQLDLLARSVVLDANAFPQATGKDARTVVPAGTPLQFSVTLATRYAPYSGTGKVEGILKSPIELLAGATAANEPAAMYFHEAVFATTAIVGFTSYASQLVSSMPTCKFE
jgi:hypothetical protein